MMIALSLLVFVALLGAAFFFLRRPRPEPQQDQSPATQQDEPVAFTPVRIPQDVVRPPAAAKVEVENPPEVGSDFYEEIVGLLEAELSRNKHRQDLRFKLLEVYAATDRREAFVALAETHRLASAEREGVTDPYWDQIIELGQRVAPDHALFQPKADPAAPAAPSTTAPPQKFRRYYDSLNQQQLGAAQVEIHKTYQALRQDPAFWRELHEHAVALLGEPAPLQHSAKLSRFIGGAQIYVRNDSRRPPAHAAFISAIGQALLARAMGIKCLVAAPQGAGHALAVASIAQKLGIEARLLMTGTEQTEHTPEMAAAVERGAVIEFLPESLAANESQRQALSRAIAAPAQMLYVSPLAAGPFPYPVIIREVQGVFGLELKAQLSALIGRAPDGLIVSATDGMPTIGFLQPYLGLSSVRLFCVESASDGLGAHQRLRREHAWLQATRRVRYSPVPEEVARFAARYCLPDHVDSLNRAGGEVLVETFTLSRQFTAEQAVVVIIPAEPAVDAA